MTALVLNDEHKQELMELYHSGEDLEPFAQRVTQLGLMDRLEEVLAAMAEDGPATA